MLSNRISALYCAKIVNSVTGLKFALFSDKYEFLAGSSAEHYDELNSLFSFHCAANIPPVPGKLHGSVLDRYTVSGDSDSIYYILFVGEEIPSSLVIFVHTLIGSALEQYRLLDSSSINSSEHIYFVNQLTTIDRISDEYIESTASQLNYDVHCPRAAIVFSVNELLTGKRSPCADLFSRPLVNWVTSLSESASSEDIIGMLNTHEFVVFKACMNVETEKYLKKYAQAVISEMMYYTGLEVKVGIGSVYDTVDQLRFSYDEAKFSASYCDFFSSGEKCGYTFVTDHIFEYFVSLINENYLEKKFQPFEKAFEQNETLRETVVSLSANNINLIQTAESLGIHRNTMQQRYARMKELLRVDPLENTLDRMLLRQYAIHKSRKRTLNIGICIQDGSALHECCNKFSEILSDKSSGTVCCNVHTILLSGNNNILLDLLKNGSLDMIIIDSHALRDETGGMTTVFDLPFLFDSADESNYVLDSEFGREISDRLERRGLINLACLSTGFRHISTRSGFITRPEDLEGLSIRIMHKPINEEYFRTMKAVPIMTSYADILTLLQRGIIDSQENPYANFLAMRFYEYQPYISELTLYYGVDYLLTSTALMQSLSSLEKDMVRCTAREMTQWHRSTLEEFNRKSRDTLVKQYGIHVYPVEKQPLKLWKMSAKPVYHNYPDQETLKKVLEKKKEYAKKLLPKAIG